jgi:hypothetical protein
MRGRVDDPSVFLVDYRISGIHDQVLLVIVIDIGHRREIYR